MDVMAAGLGAVWSLLPSKLRVPTLGENIGSQNGEEGVNPGGMVLGADLSEPRDGEDDIRLSTDESVRNQIGMLVKLFGFLQDTEHPNQHFNDTTPNADDEYETESDDSDPDAELSILSIWIRVGEASLNAIQSSFLENVLYPSILECSPTDGSSVAIMSYLDILLSNLDYGVLLDRLTDFLLCQGMCRSDERFTMKDLILDNIQSSDPGSITAGLKLFTTIIREHCGIATYALFSTTGPGYVIETRQPIPNSNEIDLYASLVERLDHTQSNLEHSSSYTSYLTDTHSLIQNDRCFQRFQLYQNDPGNSPPLGKHIIEPHNIMLQPLLQSLANFLCRGADENVALTGVFVTMARCPFRSLEGWLTYHMEDPRDTVDNEPKERSSPSIHQILSDLVSQISTFRSQIPNFDSLLQERRSGLLYTENIDEAMNVMLDVEPSNVFGTPTPTQAPMPVTPTPKKKGMMGTLASYLTPTRSPASSPAPVTPQRPKEEAVVTMSPYKAHYETLAGQEIEVVPATIPDLDHDHQSRNLDRSISDSASVSNSSGPSRPVSSLAASVQPVSFREKGKEEGEEGRKVSLSTILDNCIVLEEFIKELVAVISARRALGIDAISF